MTCSHDEKVLKKIDDLKDGLNDAKTELLSEIRDNKQDIAILKLKVKIIGLASGLGGAGILEAIKKIF